MTFTSSSPTQRRNRDAELEVLGTVDVGHHVVQRCVARELDVNYQDLLGGLDALLPPTSGRRLPPPRRDRHLRGTCGRSRTSGSTALGPSWRPLAWPAALARASRSVRYEE
jgi:hypothetical protein